jgi:pyrroloquinoline quinone biosynthesis protein A
MICPNLHSPDFAMMATIKQALENFNSKGVCIMWTKPQATEMRFGFEVTMYVCNR